MSEDDIAEDPERSSPSYLAGSFVGSAAGTPQRSESVSPPNMHGEHAVLVRELALDDELRQKTTLIAHYASGRDDCAPSPPPEADGDTLALTAVDDTDGTHDRSLLTFFSNPTTRWRVKIYSFYNGTWRDEGTGFCWGHIVEDEAYLLVDDEDVPNSRLLQSIIPDEMTYHKQGTAISFTEKTSAEPMELAMSFQETDGCITVCEFLLYVREHMKPDITLFTSVSPTWNEAKGMTGEVFECVQQGTRLPPAPTPHNLDTVMEITSHAGTFQYGRDTLAVYFRQTDYIRKLFGLFEQAETGGSPDLTTVGRLKTLRRLSGLVKAIFGFGDPSLVNLLLEERTFASLLGIFEYDVDFAPKKANFRHYLAQNTRLKDLSGVNEAIAERIRHTFRLQVLKDVIFSRILDDVSFAVITNLIYANHAEIVTALQSSEFTRRFLRGYREEADAPVVTQSAHLDEGLQFVYHVIMVSKTFLLEQRLKFYHMMFSVGLADVLHYGLVHEDLGMCKIALESLASIMDSDATLICKLDNSETDSKTAKDIVNDLVVLLTSNKPPSVQLQACETIKLFLEPPLPGEMELYFFRIMFPRIVNSLDLHPDNKHHSHVLNLMTFCFQRYPVLYKYTSISPVWNVVGRLLSREIGGTSLLAAIRCATVMLSHGLDHHVHHIVGSGVLATMFDMLVEIGNVNNTLHTACIQFFAQVTAPGDTRFLCLRQWIALNRVYSLPRLDYITCFRNLVDEDTSDDEARTLKRPKEGVNTEDRSPQRRRIKVGGNQVLDTCHIAQTEVKNDAAFASRDNVESPGEVTDAGNDSHQVHAIRYSGAWGVGAPGTPQPKQTRSKFHNRVTTGHKKANRLVSVREKGRSTSF